ncbi:MAG: DEAD/DEAH box helicase, partial [Planctomycetes bacterium]|nr:DEAD/DEAH box helicase [Planctomycetota bacterium]
PKHRGDLLAASVVADRMRQGLIEELAMPERPLDVLAQQLVAIVATEPTTLEAAEALVRRAAPFRELSRELFVATLDMLCGRFAAEDFADLRPRLVWDRHTGDLRARRGSKTLSLISGGTIPDRGLYPVRLGPDGPRVGELDEEMVHETRPGQVITLGTTSWRVLEITRDRVIVQAAAGEAGRLPFWRGDGPGRPAELGLAIGVFLRRMERLPGEERMQRLQTDHGLDPQAASNLNRYLGEQTTATGALPTDRRLVVESFRDELGDWRLCLLAPLGARVLAPLALAIEARLGREFSTTGQVLWTDDGIVVRMADGDRLPDLDEILPDVEELEAQVTETLAGSPLFAQAFRENAARALLLPRRKPGQRTPLWVQRLRAQSLLSVVQTHPSFPIVLETYRHCLRDVFDLPATKALLTGLRDRSIRIKRVTTDAPSPFARSLVFAFTQQFLYEGDLPASERRAQALTLDRRLLRELLGEEDLRQLLDARSIAAVHAELQAMADGFRARDPDELHDLLRRLGDLSADEIQARCDGDGAAWTQGLVGGGRAIWLRIAGDHRLVAIEDAAWFRDALGLPLPLGLPEDLLTGVDEALPRL